MSQSIIQKQDLLPSTGSIIAGKYPKMNVDLVYSHQMIILLLESKNCFGNDCPRSSIIVAGEAFFRFLLDALVTLVKANGTISYKFGRQSGTLTQTDFNQLHHLDDELNFSTVSKIIANELKLSPAVQNRLNMVRELRNAVTHSELPALYDWDPDEPRAPHEFDASLKEENELPEGYQFTLINKYNVDIRTLQCKSLKGINAFDKFAAIQYSAVVNLLMTI